MDPLSVTASVAGVLAAAAKVSSVLWDVTKQSKHAPQSVRDVKTEVDSFRVTLKQLEGFCYSEAGGASDTRSMDTGQSGCCDTLKSDSSMGIMDRLRRVSKASTATELLHKIQSQKMSLVTMLMILESQSSLQAEEAVESLDPQVKKILESNRIIEERLLSLDIGSTARTIATEPTPGPDPSDIAEQSGTTEIQRDVQGFAFEEELSKSWVYKRADNQDEGSFSVISSAGRTASWSMLSGLSMSDISNISILALPVYAEDIANREQYKFGDPGEIAVSGNTDVGNAHETTRGLLGKGFSSRLRILGVPSLRRGDKAVWARTDKRDQVHPPRIFGVRLQDSIRYANVAISTHDADGGSLIRGYVPIVIAKCGVYLKETGMWALLLHSVSAQEMQVPILKIYPTKLDIHQEFISSRTLFDSPDPYGKGLDWVGYTPHDAAHTMLRYTKLLSQPVVPYQNYDSYRSSYPLLAELTLPLIRDLGIMDRGTKRAINALRASMIQLPPLNRQLFEYLLDLMAVFASKSELNKMTCDRIVACFRPGSLSLKPEQMDEEEHIAAHKILCFMVMYQSELLFGQLPDEEEDGSAEEDDEATKAIDTKTGVGIGPLKKSKSF